MEFFEKNRKEKNQNATHVQYERGKKCYDRNIDTAEKVGKKHTKKAKRKKSFAK